MKNRTPFIKIKRNKEAIELMKKPFAFMLLLQIAQRARRTNEFNIDNLKCGEAKIGDYKSIGLTEATYKTAKKHLQKWGLVTFQATNKGTIAKLVSSRIVDINIEGDNDQDDEPGTSQERTNDEQLTTNKNDKNDKNEEDKKTKAKKAEQKMLEDEKKKLAKRSEPKIKIPDWINSEDWNEWLKSRTKKKYSNSSRALNRILNDVKQFEKEGHSHEEINKSLSRSMIAVYPEIYEPKNNNNKKSRLGWKN